MAIDSKYLRRALNGFRLRFNGHEENQRKVGIFDIKNIGINRIYHNKG